MPVEIKHVLIVEDDLSLRPLWTVIIRRCSEMARIDWAVSSEEAEKIIKDCGKKDPFDLIIADLFLAGSNTGLEFLGSSEVQKTQALTMLVSLASQSELEEYCRKLLPNAKIVAKPLNVVKCERAINELTSDFHMRKRSCLN